MASNERWTSRYGGWSRCVVVDTYDEGRTVVATVDAAGGARDWFSADDLTEETLAHAAEAVARARDAVVDAAKEWTFTPHPNSHISDAVHDLLEAERVEAEMRVELALAWRSVRRDEDEP